MCTSVCSCFHLTTVLTIILCSLSLYACLYCPLESCIHCTLSLHQFACLCIFLLTHHGMCVLPVSVHESVIELSSFFWVHRSICTSSSPNYVPLTPLPWSILHICYWLSCCKSAIACIFLASPPMLSSSQVWHGKRKAASSEDKVDKQVWQNRKLRETSYRNSKEDLYCTHCSL